ncbi:hypothetical protein STIAU_3354 [Stigmatella aurantiaca DW4/3-1]|uniref:Uncharacterized protein n=1 Tax=Stigmatella aurantiaca (strain DW4/3-1) TaxID=378806 RepID=Q099J4_STIAD|nr:hypothetical protein STIAU_3354 [Stigmatella aurantiaca DW4/3-1]
MGEGIPTTPGRKALRRRPLSSVPAESRVAGMRQGVEGSGLDTQAE